MRNSFFLVQSNDPTIHAVPRPASKINTYALCHFTSHPMGCIFQNMIDCFIGIQESYSIVNIVRHGKSPYIMLLVSRLGAQ